MSNLKKYLAGAAIAAASLFGMTSEAKAGDGDLEQKTRVTQRTAVDTDDRLSLQTAVDGYLANNAGTYTATLRREEGFNSLGLNANLAKGYHLNISHVRNKDDDTAKSRLLLEKDLEGKFYGLDLQDVNGEIILDARGGMKLRDDLEAQVAAGTDTSFGGVLLYHPNENSLVAVGGHGTIEDGTWEANAAYSTRLHLLGKETGLSTHARIGNNDFKQFRIRLGQGVSGKKSQIYDVRDTDFNTIAKVDDQSLPFYSGPFSLLDEYTFAGNKKGGFGLFANYTEAGGNKGTLELKTALNLADDGKLSIGPGATFDFENSDNSRPYMEVRSHLFDVPMGDTTAGVNLWYRFSPAINSSQTDTHAAMIGATFDF